MGKLSVWAQLNHKGPCKEKEGGLKRREGGVTTGTEIGVMWL